MHNGLTQRQASDLLRVSRRLTIQAGRVLSEDGPASPVLREALENGQIKIGSAHRMLQHPVEVQEQALDSYLRGHARTLSAAVRTIVGELPQGNPSPQPAGRYRTIVVDPPWPRGGLASEGQRHQESSDGPAMTVEEIAGLTLGLSEEAFVFLWTTQEWLQEAFRVLERWGLAYQFTMAWHKTGGNRPPGSRRRDELEFVLVGTRGDPTFARSHAFGPVIEAPWGEVRDGRSVKPDEFYSLLGRIAPGPIQEVPESGASHFPPYLETPVETAVAG